MSHVRPADLLGVWRHARAELDWSPWPGPRPLHGDDKEVLVGRDEDKARFRREVTSHRLILLTGMTGVGKTSLLEAGLVPDLRESGYTVGLCRDWSGSADETNSVSFLSSKIKSQLEGQVDFDLPDGARLFWALNEKLNERCVIVLDQFEELIRDAPVLIDALFKLLVEVNRRTHLRVVVSFRSEYLHELAELEQKVQAFSLTHVALSPVEPQYARDIVVAPNRRPGHQDRPAITEAAADRVTKLWRSALEVPTDSHEERRGVRIGLLHLQGLLYVLASRCSGRTVEGVDVEKLASAYPSAAEVFRTGLHLAVHEKLDRCRRAAQHPDVRLDRYLVDGTLQMVVDAVTHLSSAGYKLVRDVRDLAEATLGDRLDSLHLGIERCGAGLGEPDGAAQPEQERALLGAVLDLILPDRSIEELDLLAASRAELAARADGSGPRTATMTWLERLHDGRTGPEVDAADVTCGPMLGHAPAAVLIEQLRRFVFALEWLHASDLVRISTPGTGGAMIALIHDGFGAALDEWARAAGRGPSGELAAITAPRGGSFDWDETPEPPVSEVAEPRLLVNLRWRGAWVTARFTDVVFVNCDFRGTGFSRCVFDGVAFVNCLLDGAMFTDCEITGDPPPAERQWFPHAPRFVIPGPEDVVSGLEHYLERSSGATAVLSQLPGLPAVPLFDGADSGPDDSGPALQLTERPAGLVVLGGRVSTLMIRACTFSGDSALSFRHVGGSGLDVVEVAGGRVEIVGSALRHITFSAATVRDAARRGLQIDLVTSSIAQLWVSEGVVGTLAADNCMLLQVWNGSGETEGRAANCSYHGLVGVVPDAECVLLGPDQAVAAAGDVDADGTVHERVRRMDYRRDPHRAVLTPAEAAAQLPAR
ncbi:hypothetical protein E4P40_24975 [Blastococcus sp. CT_GayMR20]|uniref:nSTAND1 domain-containing NTPase n=1 Tax=Blastococcus sp. CT_GayMR20 TaxID=2559609 RepID=UPI001074054E|nr:pentapeptide repeat-containing protein [Blastococcus sp. CT_GayMR20]TFV66843.1 hypothetical protein E4P40_24960 [Blastococcus sp. CT_GayMR20]TFV66846.1 hypothetical protein E4P40_24975 [Blastococcus sp. CT_GayMR20]